MTFDQGAGGRARHVKFPAVFGEPAKAVGEYERLLRRRGLALFRHRGLHSDLRWRHRRQQRPPQLRVEAAAGAFEDRARHGAQEHAVAFGEQVGASQKQAARPIEPRVGRARFGHSLEIVLHVLAVARRNFVEHDQIEFEAARPQVFLSRGRAPARRPRARRRRPSPGRSEGRRKCRTSTDRPACPCCGARLRAIEGAGLHRSRGPQAADIGTRLHE